MHRRRFLLSLLASGVAPLYCRAAERNTPRNLKITGVDVLVTNPPQARNQNFVLVKIRTSEPYKRFLRPMIRRADDTLWAY